ncbi:MAG: ABC transporter ATP-binding protein [Clostridia bacterium]|nr:ABC transporter ATP-binding protein [Clostridia bacterium]
MFKKKEKGQHGVISNVFFLLKIMFQISPGLVIGEILTDIITTLPDKLISVIGIKYVIDQIGKPDGVRNIFIALGIMVGVIIFENIVNALFFELFAHRAREKMYLGIHSKLYEKAISLDLASYDDSSFYSDFILAIETSSENIRNILNLVRGYVSQIIAFISIGTIMFTIDPVCLVIILFFVITFLPIGKHTGNLQMQRREAMNEKYRKANYFSRLFYLPEFAGEMRMHSITGIFFRRFRESADDITKTQRKYVGKIDGWFFVQAVVVQIIGFMLVLTAYIGYQTLEVGALTASDFVSTFNGAASISSSVLFLTVYSLRNFTERSKMIEKYRTFLSTDFKIKDGGHIAQNGEAKDIEIKNISFTYPGNDSPTLKNISMTIHPGEKIALVGYNGAGKTTLTNLLLRLYDVTEGEIVIDGRDIREETVTSHRDRFAAVFQDFKIFGATVGENVALQVDYDKDRVLEALSHAGFRKELPKGTETILLREFSDDGLSLSGGEEQKVAIARAFYKKCPYIILDEPSANLDPVSEYELNQSMMEAAKDKTVIFISHRLSTTRHADRIFMMENGEIVERGSHEELMKLNGKYAYMFNLQAEKYKQ